MKNAARLISYLGHPIFLPLLGLYLALNSDSYLNYFTPEDAKLKLYLLFAIHSILLPGLSLMVMRRTHLISSMQLINREERTLPFLVNIVYIAMIYYLLRDPAVPQIITSMIAGMLVLQVSVLLLNFRWKISIHCLGAGGLVGGYLALSQVLEFNGVLITTLLVLATGIIATSRLILQAHKAAEVYTGLLIGFCMEYLIVKNEWWF